MPPQYGILIHYPCVAEPTPTARFHSLCTSLGGVEKDLRFERIKHLLPQQFGDERLLGVNRRWRFYRYYSGNLPLGLKKTGWKWRFSTPMPYVPMPCDVFTAEDDFRELGKNRLHEILMQVPHPSELQQRYRKHLDGAWPASGIALDDGQEKYIYDAHGGGTRSKLTFIIYLTLGIWLCQHTMKLFPQPSDAIWCSSSVSSLHYPRMVRNDDFEGGCTTFFTPKPGEEGTLHSRPTETWVELPKLSWIFLEHLQEFLLRICPGTPA